MWPPDVQLTIPGFGSVFEDAEDLQAPLSSGGLCQSSLHSGGLCCLPRTSLPLSSLGRDLTSLLSCKTNGSHVDKTTDAFATTAHTEPRIITERFTCYPQPSLPLSYSNSATSPPFCPPSSSLSSSSSSSSLYFASSLPLSDASNKMSQQQLKLQEEHPSIKQEPADDFSPCKKETFHSQQGELFHVHHLLQVHDGQDSIPRPQTPAHCLRLNGPVGQDLTRDQQEQPCHWIDCSATYGSQEELVRHIEKVHIDQRKGEEFACFWAGCVRRHKPFNARYKLLIHMRVHSGEKPNKCMVSHWFFTVLKCLKLRLNTHAQFQCRLKA